MKWRICILLIVVSIGVFFLTLHRGSAPQTLRQEEDVQPLSDGAMVQVALPASFTPEEEMGERAFNAVCSVCHGTNAQGLNGQGPPLVHRIYEPSHHGDMAFVLAAQNGVRAHHWRFGNMPPVKDVTHADVLQIVSYIRALQRENGIN